MIDEDEDETEYIENIDGGYDYQQDNLDDETKGLLENI